MKLRCDLISIWEARMIFQGSSGAVGQPAGPDALLGDHEVTASLGGRHCFVARTNLPARQRSTTLDQPNKRCFESAVKELDDSRPFGC